MSELSYCDSDGVPRIVRGCQLTTDKAGRFWMWSESLQCNLAYKSKTREDSLLNAIDSLLHIVKMRDKRIESLQRIADLAHQFADAVKPDELTEY